MDYRFTKHARLEMSKRSITDDEVDHAIQQPQQIIDQPSGEKVYQSLLVRNGKNMMLRVALATDVTPTAVITVYPTTQGRYWQP